MNARDPAAPPSPSSSSSPRLFVSDKPHERLSSAHERLPLTAGSDDEMASATSKLGGAAGILIFIVSLVSYALETEFAQHLQTNLRYTKPYFLLYLAHSSFVILLPLHLLFLRLTAGLPAKVYLRGLALATRDFVLPDSPAPGHAGFWDILPVPQCFVRIGALTGLATIAAVAWWIAVDFTSAADLTAIWNSSAFWAYLFAVYFLGEPWQRSKLVSVFIACVGVACIAYGGKSSSDSAESFDPTPAHEHSASSALLGDLLVLFGSVSFALFEVALKKYGSVPDDGGEDDLGKAEEGEYEALDFEVDDDEENRDGEGSEDARRSARPGMGLPRPNGSLSMQGRRTASSISTTFSVDPPFGLHPNFVSTGIGLFTLLILWVPLPFLHWSGWEPFELPPSGEAWAYLLGMLASAVAFNGSFIVLLFLWGPVVASVSNLLTIVVIQLIDAFVRHAPITLYSVVGSGMIVGAFAILAVGMVRQKKS